MATVFAPIALLFQVLASSELKCLFCGECVSARLLGLREKTRVECRAASRGFRHALNLQSGVLRLAQKLGIEAFDQIIGNRRILTPLLPGLVPGCTWLVC